MALALACVQGDLGVSLLSSAPVLDLIMQRLAEHDPDCGLCARHCCVGRHPARRAGGDPGRIALDAFVTSVASLGVALPSFWLAILLVADFSLDRSGSRRPGARPLHVEPGSCDQLRDIAGRLRSRLA